MPKDGARVAVIGGGISGLVCARELARLGVRARRKPGAFASNELITAKYSLLSFLPVNLYEQFKRVANLYFLTLVCLQVSGGCLCLCRTRLRSLPFPAHPQTSHTQKHNTHDQKGHPGPVAGAVVGDDGAARRRAFSQRRQGGV